MPWNTIILHAIICGILVPVAADTGKDVCLLQTQRRQSTEIPETKPLIDRVVLGGISPEFSSVQFGRMVDAGDQNAAGMVLVGKNGAGGRNASEAGGEFAKFFNQHETGLGIHKWLHYFPAYHRHFSQFIGKEVHILEIGVQSGGSLEMWRDVFGPLAHVYGVDIDPNTLQLAGDRIKIFLGDQSDPKFWADFRKQVPRVDILIDDGGHKPDDLLTTLGEMLPHLAPGGIYLAEDILGPKDSSGNLAHEIAEAMRPVWPGGPNPFWDGLNLKDGFTTQASPGTPVKSYGGMANLVSSIHVYPWILVIERAPGTNTLVHQLGPVNPAQAILHADTNTSLFRTRQKSAELQEALQGAIPGFSFRPIDPSRVSLPLATEIEQLGPEGLLVVPSDWDSNLKFIQKEFMDFHQYTGWPVSEASTAQTRVDSVHVYPSFVLVKRTDGSERPMESALHGSMWQGWS